MKIEKNKVVKFSYSLTDSNNEQLEKAELKEPVAFLHGHGNILNGLEKAFIGKEANDTFSVTLDPLDGYGVYKPDAVKRIPIKHLEGKQKWKKGMLAVVQTDKGRTQVSLEKVGKFMVDVNFNHPYAGRTLTFDIEVLDVRDATAEEITHGHAHGVGGHHH